MTEAVSVRDGIALLERSSLPTVLTEGSSDYRVIRRIEERLADCGLDFLPLGGRTTVLGTWSGLSAERRNNVVALVDLDTWIYLGIPLEYQHRSIIYTQGYSIENDIFMDSDLIKLCDSAERIRFYQNLERVCAYHAREIEKCRAGEDYELSIKAHKIVRSPDISPSLNVDELALKNVLFRHFGQVLRGKSLFELLSIELTNSKRRVKFGYDHLYEIGSAGTGLIFANLEKEIRARFT